LLDSDKKLSDLKGNIDTTETTILHVLKEFEKLDLTIKNAGVYSLSSLGRIEAQISRDTHTATQALEKFKSFWLNHDVQPIPPHLMSKLGMLHEATIIKSETSELGKVHNTFVKILMNAKRILGISPIFHPDYVGIFKNMLNLGGNIDLIVTDEVFNRTFEAAITSGEGELFQKFMVDGHLNIYLIDNIKIALTVTDNSLSLGLFNLNGEYDYSTDLLATDPAALIWGDEVFAHYLKQAKKVNSG